MRFWIRIIFAVLVGLVAAVLIGGALLPVGHTASLTARYEEPPEAVWEAITHFEGAASWRSNVDAMEQLPAAGAGALWREHSSTGPITYRVEEFDPPRLLRMRIADDNLPFGGTWTYEISADGGGSLLKITEDGEVYNWVFRFMSRFVFGHTATMRTYLVDLGRKFGEQTVPM